MKRLPTAPQAEVCHAVGEAAHWVATLSMDEPAHEYTPWRSFMAAAWLSTALATALPAPALPSPVQQ